jgi:hypothetical protein
VTVSHQHLCVGKQLFQDVVCAVDDDYTLLWHTVRPSRRQLGGAEFVTGCEIVVKSDCTICSYMSQNRDCPPLIGFIQHCILESISAADAVEARTCCMRDGMRETACILPLSHFARSSISGSHYVVSGVIPG